MRTITLPLLCKKSADDAQKYQQKESRLKLELSQEKDSTEALRVRLERVGNITYIVDLRLLYLLDCVLYSFFQTGDQTGFITEC